MLDIIFIPLKVIFYIFATVVLIKANDFINEYNSEKKEKAQKEKENKKEKEEKEKREEQEKKQEQWERDKEKLLDHSQ